MPIESSRNSGLSEKYFSQVGEEKLSGLPVLGLSLTLLLRKRRNENGLSLLSPLLGELGVALYKENASLFPWEGSNALP